MTRRLVLLALVLVASTLVASAHDGHIHKRVLGTVTSVTEEALAIKDVDGKEHDIKLTPQTRVLRGTTRVERSELKEGERVAVGVSSDDPPYTAVEVRLGQR